MLTPCVFLGYPSNHRGYECLELSSRKIIISRHIIFDEDVFPFFTLDTSESSYYGFLNTNDEPFPYHTLPTLITN